MPDIKTGIKGKLTWQGSGKDRMRRIRWESKNGFSQPSPIPAGQLARELFDRTEDEIEVELDLENGQARRIRPVGQAWINNSPSQSVSSDKLVTSKMTGTPESEKRDGFPKRSQKQSENQQIRESYMPNFHNPYNFVPAPPRDLLKADNGLADSRPVGHDRFFPDRWSGRIRVKLTTITPLLIPDSANPLKEVNGQWVPTNSDDRDHKSYPIRLGPDGNPHLAPTSIKGMLRASYEAVTNSRLSIFVGHAERLAQRMPPQEGLKMVPARIEKVNGQDRVVLHQGTSAISNDGSPAQGNPLYAAWLQLPLDCLDYNGLAIHKKKVWAYITSWTHANPGFKFWNVVELRDGNLVKPTDNPNEQRHDWGKAQLDKQPRGQWVQGFVCITNKNFDRKHDERVFFTTEPTPIIVANQNEEFNILKDQWRELIKNYRSIHQKEIAKNQDGPSARRSQDTIWSRHIWPNGGLENEEELSEGTLCYAQVVPVETGWRAIALYPVMIARQLHKDSPEKLLPPKLFLRPAICLDELSPADRVFGWVNHEGKGAYRGNLRIDPVKWQPKTTDPNESAVEQFGVPGFPLAILGEAKPQQARFYVAKSTRGDAQEDGIGKNTAGFVESKGLRGRKVYPHHNKLLPDYWEKPNEDRTQQNKNGFFQEYRRPHKPRVNNQDKPLLNSDSTGYQLNSGEANEQRDDQNRSIQNWVKTGTDFIFDIHVTNLSPVELGALIWLLDLANTGYENHYLRLGGGKPLGFGSVQLAIDWDNTDLRLGKDWGKYYMKLNPTENPNRIAAEETLKEFKKAVESGYGQFENVSFISSFLRCARGFDDGLPIHYPRTRPLGFLPTAPVPPHPQGKAFEWFSKNERTGNPGGPKLALHDLAEEPNGDPGLPILNEILN